MGAEEGVSAAPDSLIGREVDAIVESLVCSHPRELRDNPDGVEVLGDAVRDTIRLGLEAGCEHAGRAGGELDFEHAEAWALWRRQRDRTPEARAWPAELAATERRVVAHARELVEDAGRDLGLHGRPDGTVRVALAANQAEAELLQGVLTDAGIPSNWRRTGGDLPELLAAGYREIYVPETAAGEAQALLATLETADSEQDAPPTRRIGLERTGLRLIGKATALPVVAGILVGVLLGRLPEEPALGLIALVAILVAGAAILVWSERAGRG